MNMGEIFSEGYQVRQMTKRGVLCIQLDKIKPFGNNNEVFKQVEYKLQPTCLKTIK